MNLLKNFKNKKIVYQRGQVVILNTLFFVAISLILVSGLAEPAVSHLTSSKSLIRSKESFLTSQSAVEEAYYRLKTGMTLGANETITFASSSATISTTDTSGGKRITVNALADGFQRNIQMDLSIGTGVSFHYGIQAGTGGFVMNGGSQIIGNAYSNGNIVATNGVTITGSAFAADSAALTADQTNDTPTMPANSVNFRNISTSQDFAQSFTVSNSSPINKMSFYMKKTVTPPGSPANITVRVVTDSGGFPSTNNVLSSNPSLSASAVGSSYGWVDVVFSDNPELTPGTTYWVVLDSSTQNSGNYYTIGANSTYANGTAKVGRYSSTWTDTSPTNLDGYFKVYLGGLTSTIGGGSYPGALMVGSAGVGDAWANRIEGVTVAGSMYCKFSDDTSPSSCNTSRPNPTAQPYPVSEGNILDWKDEAVSGGTTSGDVTVGWAGATIGPRKITGNLLVNGGGTLTLTGTVWVEGTLTLGGGGRIILDPLYGSDSGVIVMDGNVSIAGGGSMAGSGTAGSYLMILTTSDCPYGTGCGGSKALTLSGGAGAVVLNAQNGEMQLNGGSGVRAGTAHLITLSGGATVTYDSGLADTNFSNGPGGGYSIVDWSEI